MKLEPREDIDIPGVKKTDWQNSKKIIEQLTNQVNRLQDEKVNLRTKVVSGCVFVSTINWLLML